MTADARGEGPTGHVNTGRDGKPVEPEDGSRAVEPVSCSRPHLGSGHTGST